MFRFGDFQAANSFFLTIAIEPFHFGSSPRCFPEKLEARRNTGFVCEAANGNFLAHCLPSHMRDKLFKHHFERDAVQWIQRTPSSHVIDAEECLHGRNTPMGDLARFQPHGYSAFAIHSFGCDPKSAIPH